MNLKVNLNYCSGENGCVQITNYKGETIVLTDAEWTELRTGDFDESPSE